MHEVIEALKAATWVPAGSRGRALARATLAGEPERRLLGEVIEARSVAGVECWVDLMVLVLPKDPRRQLDERSLRKALSLAAAKTLKPAKLRALLLAIADASPATLPDARAALLEVDALVGVSLAKAHGIYLAAARSAPVTALPKTPPHLDGPTPELSVLETVEVAVSLARSSLDREPGHAGEALLALARAELAWVRQGRQGPEPTTWEDEPKTSKAKGRAWGVARAALIESRNTDHVSGRGTSLKSAAVSGMPEGGEAEWLTRIDEAVMLGDARTWWERRNLRTSSPIAKLVWRGGDASTRLWLVQLEQGPYALLAKLGARWASNEGGLEEVCATLPDGWFARAMPHVEARR